MTANAPCWRYCHKGNWGERIYTAFKNRWLELGGTIADQRYYPNRPDYNPDVRALLNVNDSQQRYNLHAPNPAPRNRV